MSRAVQPDFEFDKTRLSDLLKEAKGNLSLNLYATKCGISVGYLCKYMSKKFDNPPTPTTLKKISAFTEQNGVTFEDLLTASGYIPEKYLDTPYVASKRLQLEKLVIATITLALSKKPFKWSVSPIVDKLDNQLYDLDIAINDDNITHWLFSFRPPVIYMNSRPKFYRKSANSNNDVQNIFNYFGNLMAHRYQENTKLSFVTTSEEVYNQFRDFKPHMLNMYISIILVDLEKMEILEESYLDSALDISQTLLSTYKLDKQS